MPVVMALVAPRRVVDIGCGEGSWLAVFRDHGVETIFGIEGEWLDEASLEIPEACFLHRDLTRPLALDQHFDLAISLEVTEHREERYANSFVETLVGLAPTVFFSAAVPY